LTFHISKVSDEELRQVEASVNARTSTTTVIEQNNISIQET
jgi:hypothetical protein